MEYTCGPLILSSQDKIRMMDFLSDVFEFDVDTEQDLINLGHLTLKLIDTTINHESSGVTFAFQLKDPEQIKEIQNKFNFFLYRKSQDPNNERFKFIEQHEDASLQILDFDGRTWRFDILAKDSIHDC